MSAETIAGNTYMTLDLETSGLYHDHLPEDHPEQPFIIQAAGCLYDWEGAPYGAFDILVKPPANRSIEPDALKVHGISLRRAKMFGYDEIAALGVIINMAGLADEISGHAIDFERKVVTAALARNRRDPMKWTRPGLQTFCTMKESTEFAKIPNNQSFGGYKWPKLQQAAKALLEDWSHVVVEDDEPATLHSAAFDRDICKRLRLRLSDLHRAYKTSREGAEP